MTRTDELKNQIALLEKQLNDAQIELSKLLSCIHQWGEAVIDPEISYTEIRNPGIEEMGTTLTAPKPVIVTKFETKQRWSRTCLRCGEKEYTYEIRAVKFEPLFK